MALYLEHFGLNEPPFRITPHLDFFFAGADRGATLEGLLYAVLHDEGIVKVSGEIGSGKTMLCRMLIERLPSEVETVFLANPSYSRSEIVQTIAAELGLPAAGTLAPPALRDLQMRLIELYASGRRVVVMIDEAQAMPADTLEQVRLLSNLQTGRHKLLQIVLFGQPELDEVLAKPNLRQLLDRITHNFSTRALKADEVAHYVAFRMRTAGYRGPDNFSAAAIAAIARSSHGLTRRINVLCDKSLLAAFAANTHAITPREVRIAIADSSFASLNPSRRAHATGRVAAAAGLVLALGVALGLGVQLGAGRAGPPDQPNEGPRVQASPQASAAHAPASPAPPSPPAYSASPPPAAPLAPPASAAASTASVVAEAQSQNDSRPLDTPPRRLSAGQLRRFEGYRAAGQTLLRERLAATREKLASEPDDCYSVELFVAENSDPARTERFLGRARDLVPLDEVYVVPLAAAAGYQLRVTYGIFANEDAALQAARRLPPKYQQAFRLEPRSLAVLRASL